MKEKNKRQSLAGSVETTDEQSLPLEGGGICEANDGGSNHTRTPSVSPQAARQLPRRGSLRTNPHRASEKIRFLAVTGMIAGIYTALTLVLAPLSFGIIQCRVAEALTVLAVYHPAAVAGLTVGCALSNFVGLAMGANTAGALDILLGTLATGLAAWLSYLLRNVRWGGLPVLSTLPPVVLNALIIGTELTLVLGPRNLPTLLMWMGSVAVGQVIACVGGGLILAKTLQTSGLDRRLAQNSFTNR